MLWLTSTESAFGAINQNIPATHSTFLHSCYTIFSCGNAEYENLCREISKTNPWTQSVKFFTRKGPERPERPEGLRQGSKRFKGPLLVWFCIWNVMCVWDIGTGSKWEQCRDSLPSDMAEGVPATTANPKEQSKYLLLLCVCKDKLQDPLACHWYVIHSVYK